MTTQPPAATLGVSDLKAAETAVHLVDLATEAMNTAHLAMPEDYWSQHEWLAKAAVRAVLHGLGTRAGSWVHTTDFAVLSSWVDHINPPPELEQTKRYGTSGGVELTNEALDRLVVDEAEKGYDVDQIRPKRLTVKEKKQE